MPLNDRQIKNAKPAAKPYKLADGGGLHLAVTPAGGKLWRLKYRIDGKEKLLTLGKYPAVSLLEARQAAEQARADLAKGIDPAAAKQQAKAERQAALQNTFEALARRWYADNLHRWKPNHAARLLAYLEKDVFPHIGNEPIDGLKVADIKDLLGRILARGAINTAEKIRDWIGAVYDYAAMLEITDRNPARALKGFLPKRETAHIPALPREELAEFYRRLLAADIKQQNRIAVLLIMLVFVRNTELRGGQWAEIDFEARTWTIPAERMKRPRLHVVPLADWTLGLLKELHALPVSQPYQSERPHLRHDANPHHGTAWLQGHRHAPRLPQPCKQRVERAGLQPRRHRTAAFPHRRKPNQGSLQPLRLHGRAAGDDAVVCGFSAPAL